jgi:pyruvate dehydrogenase E1 component alpha subunit
MPTPGGLKQVAEDVVRNAADRATPRSPNYHMIDGLAERCAPERSLAMFSRMAMARHFDYRVKRAVEEKDVSTLVYLAVGQEAAAAAISVALEGALVLGQHRGHATYLSFGGDPVALVDELLGLPSGCCKGMGGSPPIHDFAKGIIGHNGLIGDQVPVACGVALASEGRPVAVFFGDGAAEEDYVLSSFGFAATKKLPLLFICEDNDLSVLTPTKVRRTWNVVEVARGFGLTAEDITDDPWLIDNRVSALKQKLPALINIRTCRELWHVGPGSDNNAEWNRFDLVKQKLVELGLQGQAAEIERACETFVEKLWCERLRIRYAN